MATQSDLEKYAKSNKKRLLHKYLHYFDIYELYFSRFRNKNVHILEIGVSQGGSLQMWRHYFGPKAKIYAIDINPQCKKLEEKNIEIFIGSQSDKKFLREVKEKIPPLDILIDDGGHTMPQQIITYQEMFSHIKDNGIYVCEDLGTSYGLNFGGGHKRCGTFIEYSKNFIDQLNAFHSQQKTLPISTFTKTVNSLHYYDSMLIIEKKKKKKPVHQKTGKMEFENSGENFTRVRIPYKKLLKKGYYLINTILSFFKLPDIIIKYIYK